MDARTDSRSKARSTPSPRSAKLKNGFWLFQSRIQYGNHDATLALPLEVKWAGDTPVITLTDYTVPGFGKFTCRIARVRQSICRHLERRRSRRQDVRPRAARTLPDRSLDSQSRLPSLPCPRAMALPSVPFFLSADAIMATRTMIAMPDGAAEASSANSKFAAAELVAHTRTHA